MFWADEVLQNRKGKEFVNDGWTPSGIVHMGGLKGPVIHDVLARVLKEQGKEVTNNLSFDDFDPIDGLPQSLMASHKDFMGVPIFLAPSPDGKGSFGDFYGRKMREMLKALGIDVTVYLASENYKKGLYNDGIKMMLDSVKKVRKVYEEMYKKPVRDDWYPLQVICAKCGKLGTTKVTDWDGKEVTFTCLPDLVTWAEGCGQSGKMSPFDGNAKMPWKPEWAIKWYTFQVSIEWSGKDHMSKGGSFEIAANILKSVFNQKPPMAMPYEFFLWNGKKMSSSKGLGLIGEELLEVVPPQIARFLMIKSKPNQAIEFNPHETQIIPKLFDEYQQASVVSNDNHRAFQLSQIEETEKVPEIRFSTLAQWVQMPNMEDEIKKQGLEQWTKYAKVWVEKYAPESEKFVIQKNIPSAVSQLSEKQKQYLKKVSDELEKEWDPEVLQKELYEWAKEANISSKEAFEAMYLSLIGKGHGPKAAWFILSLDKDFVKKRFNEIHSNDTYYRSGTKISIKTLQQPDIFYIDSTLRKAYPSISIGIAVIKGVSIEESNAELEKEKETLLNSLGLLTTEQLGQYPEIQSYRKLYKAMGVDWHSRRPSPEALLRRVALKKGLYTVNTCVDAYNLIVMKHRVSIGAFDFDSLEFPTVLRLPKDGEEILLLGDEEPTKLKKTEIAYFDEKGAINLDFNYRDAQRSAVQLTTKNLYVNVDGAYDITPQQVETSLKETCDIIMKYCGGTLDDFGIETAR